MENRERSENVNATTGKRKGCLKLPGPPSPKAIPFPVTCFRNKMPPPIEVRHRKGIHLPEPDLWLDPPRGKARAFISHAHSDHFARHQLTICSSPTQSLIQARYGKPRAGELLSLIHI